MMSTSLRQTRRIIKKYREGGAANLAHGNRGKPSPNRLDPVLTSAIKQLLKEKYADYNTLHLTEILEERHAFRVSASSLTRIRLNTNWVYRSKLAGLPPRMIILIKRFNQKGRSG